MKIPAKRRFGQHFLRDTGVLNRIVRLIQPTSNSLVIEIGAGDGALSRQLAPLVSRLLAIEIDRDCLVRLQSNLAQFPSVEIIPANILSLDLKLLVSNEISAGQKLCVVGNLPYNIATAIIERLIHSGLSISRMVFMVQREVAERITAPPGSHQYGYLSVACQHRTAVKLHFRVSPACFVPRPKVTSAIISLCPLPSTRNAQYEARFADLVKAAFGHRRKTLANSMRRHHLIGPHTDTILSNASIDPSRRAEDLSLAEYEKLASIWDELIPATRK